MSKIKTKKVLTPEQKKKRIRSIVDKKTWMDLPIRYQKYTGLKEKMMRMFLK
jgi:hypothetical protein